MKKSVKIFVVLLMMLYFPVVIFPSLSQEADPITKQSFKSITLSSNNTATAFSWMQMWETLNESTGQFEVVMVDARSSAQGVQDSCYYLKIDPDTNPIYIVNGSRQLVPSGDMAWNNFQNRRIFDQYTGFVEGLQCDEYTETDVDGVPSKTCQVENLETPPPISTETADYCTG